MECVILPSLSGYFWCCSFFVAKALTYIHYNTLWQSTTVHAAATWSVRLLRLRLSFIWGKSRCSGNHGESVKCYDATHCASTTWRLMLVSQHAPSDSLIELFIPLLCNCGRCCQIWEADKRFDGLEESNERQGCMCRCWSNETVELPYHQKEKFKC